MRACACVGARVRACMYTKSCVRMHICIFYCSQENGSSRNSTEEEEGNSPREPSSSTEEVEGQRRHGTRLAVVHTKIPTVSGLSVDVESRVWAVGTDSETGGGSV